LDPNASKFSFDPGALAPCKGYVAPPLVSLKDKQMTTEEKPAWESYFVFKRLLKFLAC
jgi:hypothetical protein